MYVYAPYFNQNRSTIYLTEPTNNPISITKYFLAQYNLLLLLLSYISSQSIVASIEL